MAEALIAAGQSANFEIFVLSDTQNPDVYVQETAAVQTLRDALGEFRVWYRHRHENVAKKAGNLRDFVTRWGGRYDYMIVLDADSVLSVDTLLTLVREMAADPKLGLLQTVPRLCGGAHVVRAAPAVRRRGLRAHRRARHRCLVGRRRQLLGAQRDHPHARVRISRGPADTARAQAVRRNDHVARLRRGRAAAARRLVGADAADARRLVGRGSAVAARRRRPRPPLGAGQHSASRGGRQRGFHVAEPRAYVDRRDELPRLAVVACADRRRLGRHGAHRDRAVRVLHRPAVAVPALAAVRQRKDDRAVRRRDGDADAAEDPRAPARILHARAPAQGQPDQARARRHRRDRALGALRSDHDAAPDAPDRGDPARPGLGLEPAEPAARRGRALAPAAAPPLAAHGGRARDERRADVPVAAVARMDGACAARSRARVAAVGRERQRLPREGRRGSSASSRSRKKSRSRRSCAGETSSRRS